MELLVTTSVITEPATPAEVKTYMGFPSADTSQDTLLGTLITAAREWLEGVTAYSCVSKAYKVRFVKDDACEGWYELPISPVTVISSVKDSGTTTTYQSKGLKVVSVMPDSVISVGSYATDFYVEVEFTAGETSGKAKQAVIELAALKYTERVNLDMGLLPYTLRMLIQSLSMNNGL